MFTVSALLAVAAGRRTQAGDVTDQWTGNGAINENQNC